MRLRSLVIALLLTTPVHISATLPVLAQAETETRADGEAHLRAPIEQLDLSAYEGQVVWLDFWASWCPPCLASFPWMAEMQERYRDQGFRVVAVTIDQNPAAAERFLQRLPAPFDVYFDPEAREATARTLFAMPTSFLIGRDGREIARHNSFSQGLVLLYEDQIQEALATGPD